ncbi:MAG: Nif3-like dinuclear metal center hexameric protein [Phycisphaerales bacterium]
MRVQDLIEAMERIAPTRFAEDWDNVGLLIGRAEQELSGPALLTIDLNEAVVDEAVKRRVGAIIAYHPPIFRPIKRLSGATAKERVLLRVIESRMAVYSPHTALDSAPGGMTDWLADGLLDRKGIVKADRRALRPRVDRPMTQEVKIVTFLPAEKVDDLRAALGTAGAGLIGKYEVCSFAMPGAGTFFARPGAAPAVGETGKLERVQEVRLEMVCSQRALALAMAVIKQFHPYEEPAVDVYPLLGRPERGAGVGRRLVLDQAVTLEKLADRLKTHLGIPTVKLAPASDRPVQRVGVSPGAGSEVAPLALADGCDVFVTGEMKHHEVLPLLDAGMSVILAGHTNTERGYLPALAERLGAEAPQAEFLVSQADRSPFVWK